MASHAPTTGAPTRAPSNVVRLPTAPKRKVRQNFNRAARTERAKLPQFTGEHLSPGQRAALKQAELLRHVERTATMELLTLLLTTIDDEARAKIVAGLAPGMVAERDTAMQAFAVLGTSRMTIGQRVDMDFALATLAKREDR